MSEQGRVVASDCSALAPPAEHRERPVAHILHRIKTRNVKENHPIRAYISAFNGFEPLGVCFIGAGRDSIAIRLKTGDILKIGRRVLPELAGARPFDLPILDRGCRFTRDGRAVRYFIQPEAMTPVREGEISPFTDRLWTCGYDFCDYAERQLGYFNGEVKLLDPFAAIKLADLAAWRLAHPT